MLIQAGLVLIFAAEFLPRGLLVLAAILRIAALLMVAVYLIALIWWIG